MQKRLESFVFMLALAVIVFLLYVPILGADFLLFDDHLLLFLNPLFTEFSAAAFGRVWFGYDPLHLYRPLTMMLYLALYSVTGFSSQVFHAANVCLHVCNVLLVFGLLQRLTGRARLAFVVAVLFGIHPIQTEAVAWISSTKDLLSATFMLSSLLAYLAWLETKPRPAFPRAALLWYVAALLAKASAASLPFVLLLLDWYRGRPLSRRSLMEKVPFFILSVAFSVVALVPFAASLNDVSLVHKVHMVSERLVYYLTRLLVPIGLNPAHPFTPGGLPEMTVAVVAAVAVLAGCAYIMYTQRAKHPLLLWGGAFFVINLFPSILQFGALDVNATPERYVYLASAGFFTAAVYSMAQLGERLSVPVVHWQAIVAVVLSVLSVPLLVLSAQRIGVWQTTERLYLDILARYPDSLLGHYHLAYAYQLKRHDERAANHYLAYYRLQQGTPTTPRDHVHLGLFFEDKGMYSEAARSYRLALALQPGYEPAQAQLTQVLQKTALRHRATGTAANAGGQ